MRFLRNKDYERLIQNDNLAQVIEDNYQILIDGEQAAQSEMKSYLTQRYDTAKIFTDTTEFDISQLYFGKNLVEYTAPSYTAVTSYSINDRVVYEDNIYLCLSGNTAVLPTNSAVWSYLCSDKSLFYAKLNALEFNYSSSYIAGSVVWFNDKTFKALSNISAGVKPDSNSQLWSAGTIFSFVGHYPEDINYWVRGDNRNSQMVMYACDISLYHTLSRINPRFVNELRQVRYDGAGANQQGGAIGFLKSIAAGKITADLPELAPSVGKSIEWGSNPSNANFY